MSAVPPRIAELIEACYAAPSSERAMTALDADLRPHLMAILASRTSRDPSVCEEAYQNAFYRYILLFRRGQRPARNVEAYFVAIAVNCLMDELRKERGFLPIDDVLEEQFDLPPNDDAARTEARLSLLQAMMRLQPRCQFLLSRFYLDDDPPETLARLLGVARDSIPVLVQRCRAALAAVLKEDGDY